MRRVLSDPAVGTVIPDGRQAGIGSMPDLRKIALSRGWPRIVTPAITAIDSTSVLVGFLNTENRLVRRSWQFFLGWGDLDPITADHFTQAVTTGRPVVTVRQEQDPLARLVSDAFMVGGSGIEHIWWDDQGQTGNLQRVADREHVVQGSALTATPTAEKEVAVASVNPDGQLLAMVADAGPLRPGHVLRRPLDPDHRYRRLRGPAITSRGTGTADVVAIDDGGTFRWFTGVMTATTGTGWQPGVPTRAASHSMAARVPRWWSSAPKRPAGSSRSRWAVTDTCARSTSTRRRGRSPRFSSSAPQTSPWRDPSRWVSPVTNSSPSP